MIFIVEMFFSVNTFYYFIDETSILALFVTIIEFIFRILF